MPKLPVRITKRIETILDRSRRISTKRLKPEEAREINRLAKRRVSYGPTRMTRFGPDIRTSPPESSVFEDTFTDVAGTRLRDHQPDTGGLWTESTGTWEIGAGYVARTEPFSGEDVATFYGRPNGVLTVTANLSRLFDVYFHYYNASQYWQVEVNRPLGKFLLNKRDTSGVNVAQAAISVSDGTDYTIEVTFNGPSITAVLVGITSLTTSNVFLQGVARHGIGVFTSNSSTLPRFKHVTFLE